MSGLPKFRNILLKCCYFRWHEAIWPFDWQESWAKRFPGRVNCPSTNNCESTEQSSVEGWPGTKNKGLSIEKLISRGASRRDRTVCGWARKLFFFLSRLFYSKTSLRCGSYYGAQNCLMCLFLQLMQQASRKAGYSSPRESVQHNKTCKHNLSN